MQRRTKFSLLSTLKNDIKNLTSSLLFLFSNLRNDSSQVPAAKILVNGIHLYYESYGNTGTPIILIAGFTCDHTFWSGILDALAKNHRVIVFDNRGIGQTDAPDETYTIDMMADDVMGLIQTLKLKKPIIVGQSMGSAIAQNLSKRYSDDIHKIILINTFTKLGKVQEISFKAYGDLQKINVGYQYTIPTIAPWIFSSEYLSMPNQLTDFIQFAENNPYPQTIVGYERQLGALKLFDSTSWLKDIKNPTLVIAAEADLIAPLSDARMVAEGIGNGTETIILPGGHASPIEQPAKVAAAILNFIADQ